MESTQVEELHLGSQPRMEHLLCAAPPQVVIVLGRQTLEWACILGLKAQFSISWHLTFVEFLHVARPVILATWKMETGRSQVQGLPDP